MLRDHASLGVDTVVLTSHVDRASESISDGCQREFGTHSTCYWREMLQEDLKPGSQRPLGITGKKSRAVGKDLAGEAQVLDSL